MSTCAHKLDTGRQCWKQPVAHGYCAEHVGYAPEERHAVNVLQSAIRAAEREMSKVGDEILTSHVMAISPDPVPEEMCREYRALRYRYLYLTSVLRDRRPGSELPAEVTIRTAEY